MGKASRSKTCKAAARIPQFKIGTEFIRSLTNSQGFTAKPSPSNRVGRIDFSIPEGSIHPHVAFESGDVVFAHDLSTSVRSRHRCLECQETRSAAERLEYTRHWPAQEPPFECPSTTNQKCGRYWHLPEARAPAGQHGWHGRTHNPVQLKLSHPLIRDDQHR